MLILTAPHTCDSYIDKLREHDAEFRKIHLAMIDLIRSRLDRSYNRIHVLSSITSSV